MLYTKIDQFDALDVCYDCGMGSFRGKWLKVLVCMFVLIISYIIVRNLLNMLFVGTPDVYAAL